MKKLAAIMVVLAMTLGFSAYGEEKAKESVKVKKTDDTITEKDVMDMLDKAVKLLKEKGDDALKVISTPDGDFQDGALYAFVYDENVTILAHPEKPALVGQNFKGKPDVKGKKFRDEIVAKALAGGGWTEYMYTMPDTLGIFKKKVYSKVAEKNGKKYIVACGMYAGKE